jgi:cytoskeleton protein RodZ
MSGVAKDDTNPSVPSDETASAAAADQAGATDVTATPPAIVSPPPRDEADGKPRRGAAFLRVVSDNDADFVSATDDTPPQRIGDAIRTTRENAGYTLEHVSRETRVHLSHLRAIEDMTPGLLGAPVYAKGYIRSYARYLGLPEQETLDRFLSECAAILKDPAKPEIAPPATSKARKLPVAVPVLGLLVVGLVAGGAVIFFANGEKPVAAASSQSSTPAASTSAVVAAPAVAPQLRIVALKRGMLEVRSAKGDKYVHRNYNPGEFFIVRVGEGFTVSADDGTAFEWRLGDQSLGLLQATGGPVYTQSADLAAQRQPIVPPPAPVEPSELEANAPAAATPAPATSAASTTPTPRPARTTPRPPVQQPATPPAASTTPPPAAEAPPPARDPALDAYPDVAPPAQ